jgi:hypothetical protein
VDHQDAEVRGTARVVAVTRRIGRIDTNALDDGTADQERRDHREHTDPRPARGPSHPDDDYRGHVVREQAAGPQRSVLA